MSLERKIRDLAEKFNELHPNNSIPILSIPSEIWDSEEVQADEELQWMEAYLKRRERINEIHNAANNARVARCEAKMKEVGGQNAFLDLIESGEWSDSEDDEVTEIEKEYNRLFKEEFLEDWQREHGKPYDIKDDPNAKF